MKVSINWLKEFVDVKASPAELRERVAGTAREVAALYRH